MTSKPKKMSRKYTTDEQYNMKADLWAKRVFPDMEYKEYDWVKDKNDQIAKHIFNTYDNPETIRAHINALSMLIKRYFPDSELVDKYNKLTQKYRKKIESKNEEQDNEYVPLNTILKIGNDIFQQAIREPENKKANIIGLSILMNSLHPPMRSQLYDLPIIENGSKVPETIPNYTYRDVNGRWHIVIQVKEKQKVNHNDDMVSPEMSRIIDHSLKMYPREYLISSWIRPNINLSDGTIKNNLGDLKPSLGVNVFRHSYIIDFYEKKTLYKDRKNLARMMLHSVTTADSIYDTFKGEPVVVEEQKQPKKHPPPPPRPDGVQPFTGLSKNQIAPPRHPKPVLVQVEQKEEKIDEPVVVQVVRVPKKPKQTPEERKAKNRELKKIYREKNRALLAQKELERRAKKKQQMI